MAENQTKIDAAIKDTQLRLNKVQEDIMLLSKERNVLQEQLDTLKLIKEDKQFT